jgi:stress response protein SCP2
MKKLIFAAVAGIVILTAGCVSTVTDTSSPALTWSTDKISARYQRSLDQVYSAAVTVVNNNGKVLTEYIPHDTTNSVRALSGKVNDKNVWVRVEAVDPKITELTIQARSSWGVSDVGLASELVTEVALQLARQ